MSACAIFVFDATTLVSGAKGSEVADNSTKTAKVRGRPFVKGQSGNPNGAPKRGLSWKEILEEVGELDGAQAMERAGMIFRDLKKYPKGVTLKELSAISYFIRMINDPNGSLLSVVADRTDGKVSQPLDVSVTKVIFEDAEPDSTD